MNWHSNLFIRVYFKPDFSFCESSDSLMRKRSSECHSWKNLILQFVVFTSTNDTGTQHPRKNCFVITKKRTHSMFLPLKTNKDGVIRGHLPREISRVTKFLLDRGARMTAILTSVNYRRSPLVQGGLEIPCRVKITMANTKKSVIRSWIVI